MMKTELAAQIWVDGWDGLSEISRALREAGFTVDVPDDFPPGFSICASLTTTLDLDAFCDLVDNLVDEECGIVMDYSSLLGIEEAWGEKLEAYEKLDRIPLPWQGIQD